MLYYYILLAIRNMRNKITYFFINIAGLSTGIAACLLINLYVQHHRSYDTYQTDSEKIYRILYSRWDETGDKVEFASATPIIGKALKEHIPEIESVGQGYRMEGIFAFGDKIFEENRCFYAETEFLNLLGVKIISGKAEKILDEPNTMIISRSAANRYFGNTDPIGKRMLYNQQQSFEIVGIFEDMPGNTHLKADVFQSLETWKQQNPDLFTNGYIYSGFYNYVKIREGASIEKIEKKAAQYVEKAYGENLSENKLNMGFRFQPLHDIHLQSHYMHEIEQNGDKLSVDLLEKISWFILIIAWINFFNLSTITSIKRTREISIRKVNGASRKQLILQLLTESALVNLLALMMSLLLIEILMPFYTNFTQLPSDLNILNIPEFWVILVIAFFVGTLSSGIYSISSIPASRMIDYLRNNREKIPGTKITRQILVTFQFIIAIGLITTTIIIFNQYQLISKIDTGFKTRNMLVVNAPILNDSLAIRKLHVFKDEMKQIPEIKGTAFSSVIPGKPNMFNRGGIYLYGQEYTEGKNYRVTETDADFFQVYEIPILYGEDFTGMPATDRNNVIINLYSARYMGFDKPGDAIGQKIVLDREVLTIAGITGNFHQLSAKESIEPQIFRIARRNRGYLTINMDSGYDQQTINKIKKSYLTLFPGSPFDWFMLEPFYDTQYAGEKRFGVVFLLFSVLVIIITILGLLSLAAYTAELRRKEFGIRKILGANSIQIFMLFFKDYMILWIIAGLIALPTAYLFIENWLNNFAVRTSLNPFTFVFALVVVLLITFFTVFGQSLRIIRSAPVNNIKME
ncbi:MAG: ABC transporter permease [Bacteroidota bacterium]